MDLIRLKMFVLDELDELLSRGFGDIIQDLYKDFIVPQKENEKENKNEKEGEEQKEKERKWETGKERPQVAVFSATYTAGTIQFARSLFDNEHPPLYLSRADREGLSLQGVGQFYIDMTVRPPPHYCS